MIFYTPDTSNSNKQDYGESLLLYFMLFILEFFRDDSIRGNIGILTSSQLIALLLMASIVIYTIMTRVQCK